MDDLEAARPIVLETVPLGTQWQTVDPFLFCAHHDDAYPAGDGANAPAASLAGRAIGQDFAGVDGWNMYHGSVVPGFPQHPHRGFETVTFVRRGVVDHADSLGAAARFGRGDVQWMTAGAGIVHSEMFPLLDESSGNHLQLFQIWLNLPAEDKMVDPYFTMLWDGEIPKVERTDAAGLTTTITVIAGALDDAVPVAPPPHSWAARDEADVAIWHLRMDPGAVVQLPLAEGADTVRTVYVFEGDQLEVAGTPIKAGIGVAVRSDVALDLVGGSTEVEAMVLQGRPIGEAVAQHGPFVMNTQEEIMQAMNDYQTTRFGGWPWPRPDPVHVGRTSRFARHADGHEEETDQLDLTASPS
jgi:redox-sensitive bicupin YhaK (pirin superfamily)